MSSISLSWIMRHPKRDPWADICIQDQEQAYGLGRLLCIIFAFALLAGLLLLGHDRDATGRPSPLETAPNEASPEFRALFATEPIPVVEPLQAPDLPADRARAINAAVPFVTGAIPTAFPFISRLSGVDRTRATDCLAAAMWYEAGLDWEGQRAVAQVVLNRVRHPAFPHSICGVVFQGSERTTGCQFSFTCNGAMQRRPGEALWERTKIQARAAMNGSVYARVGLATHYHTDWVAPYWSGSLDKISAVHTHLFFRWKSGWGRPVAFASKPALSEPAIAKLALLSSAHITSQAPPELHPSDAIAFATAPDQAGTLALAREQDLPAIRALPGLRGARVLLVHPEGDSFLLSFNTETPPGAYALAALDLCKGKIFCKVMGWRDAASVPGSFPITADADRTMTFVYLRQNGQEYQRWNCAQISNPPGHQCRNPAADRWDRVMK